MQSGVKRVFYFHADASALGGFVEEPFRYVPAQASVALSSAGGLAANNGGHFSFEDVVSCRSSYTHVTGRPRKINGPWIERVTASVDGLEIAGVLSAGRVTARAFVERAEDGSIARVSFEGSEFQDLRLLGKQITVVINPQLVDDRPKERTNVYDEIADLGKELEWRTLTKVAVEQSASISRLEGVPDWIKERYGHTNSDVAAKAGYTLCSLVDRIDGGGSGQAFGHTLVVTDVGRFFLGEVMTHSHSLQLTMVRAELGCNKTGTLAGPMVTTNGSPYPPVR